MCSCNLRAGVGDRDRIAGACCQPDGSRFSKRLFRGYSRQWQRGCPYPTCVCMHFASPPTKTKKETHCWRILTSKPRSPGQEGWWLRGEMLPNQDLSVIQGPTEWKRRTNSHSCPLSPTYALVEHTPIKYMDKYKLIISNNKHVECLFLNFFI